MPGLVRLNRAGKRPFGVVGHNLVTDQVEHAPCGLVRHTKLALQLLGRDPASSARHDVHGVEPQMQGRGRLVENRSGGRVNVMPAGVAVVSGAILDAVELARHTAFRALRVSAVLGVPGAPEIVEAGAVVGEIPRELHERVRRLRRRSALRVVPVDLRHRRIVPH
jgi:hypothetical protein